MNSSQSALAFSLFLLLIADRPADPAVAGESAPERKTAAAATSDCPMLGHDAARSGGTATELRPPFVRKWYRLLDDEGMRIHAFALADGRELWRSPPLPGATLRALIR